MEIVKNVSEFLDLGLKYAKESKRIFVNIFSKATNSFPYVLRKTCFPKNNIENIPKGIALHLRRICDSDSKFEKLVQNTKNIYLPEIINLAKSENIFLLLEIIRERKTEDLKIKVNFQLRVI